MNSLKKDIASALKVIIAAFIITLGVNYVSAWSGPSLPPPQGNTSTPLNVGQNIQTKLGKLELNTSATPYAVGLETYGAAMFNGNVGVGGADPSVVGAKKLEVAGAVHATLDVCTDLVGGICLSTVQSSSLKQTSCVSKGAVKDGTPTCDPGYYMAGVINTGDSYGSFGGAYCCRP